MLNIGTVLRNRYRIMEVLGSGGFGDTYLAEDLDLPRHPRCVVKQLRPKDSNPEVLRIAKALFEREAEYLYRIGNAHPEIPDLFAHFTEGGEFYLVQEYIEGHSLAQEIPQGKKLSEPEVIRLLLDILEVLAFVHQQNVIHRDIKLSNLLRRKSDGKIVLIDFGAVKDVSVLQSNAQGLTNVTVSIGSPGYMPSEQAQGKPKLSSDVYAVGMIAIQALTGIYPANLPEDVNTGEIIWQDKVQISQGFAQVLQKMVHYHFGQRYRSAVEALAALKAVVAEGVQPTQIINSAPATEVVQTPPATPQVNVTTSPQNFVAPMPVPVPPTVVGQSPPAALPITQPGQLVVPVPATQVGQDQTRQSANPALVVFAVLAIASMVGGGIWWFTSGRTTTTTQVTTTPSPTNAPTVTPTPEPTPERTITPSPAELPPQSPITPSPVTVTPPPFLERDNNLYGAIARSQVTQDKGYSWNFRSRESAEQRAIKECAGVSGATDCQVLLWFRNACGSIAESEEGAAGTGWGVTEEIAETNAIKLCSTVGSGCKITRTFCTDHQR